MRRYPRYKNSGVTWLGDIPEGWEVKRLASYFEERKVKASDKEFAALSVTKSGILPQLDNVAKTSDGDNRKLVLVGDFVINSRSDRKGSSGVSKYAGSVSLINIVLKPRGDIVGDFCNYLLKSNAFVEENYRNGRGIVADLWTTRYDEMKTIKVALPPLPEQEAIVRYLDETTGKIDKAIAAEERLIELLQERKQIIINEAVGGNISRAEAQRRGELPKGWKVLPLKRIARLKGGAGFPVQKQGRANEAIHFIKVNALASHIDPTREYDTISSDEAKEMQAKVFPKGSIVFAKVGAALLLHRFEQLPFDSCIDNNMMGLFDITENIKWLRYALSLLDFKTLVNPGAVPSVNQSQVGMMPIPLPPLPEQEEIVKYLDEETGKIDRAIEVKRRQIALLRERREIIIDEVVTGKVKVA